jgi:hypothetical protein
MRAYATIEMTNGQPNVDFTATSIAGYCLGAVQGQWGLYLVAGTEAQLTALQALPNVYRVCTTAELDTVIAVARRTKMNEWLTAQGWPNIPAGWTYGQCVRYAYKRANPEWDEARHYLIDA